MAAPRETGVYSIYCKATGRQYIGATASKGFHIRWQTHRRELRNGKHHNRGLQADWDKFGEESFVFLTLLACDPVDCIENEQWFIDEYHATDERFGYNGPKCARNQRGSFPPKCSIDGCDRKTVGRGFCPKHYGRWHKTGSPLLRKQLTPAERFWNKVDKAGPANADMGTCWIWMGAKLRDRHGYGVITVAHKLLKAHRFSWELHFGPISGGMVVCHHCDTPSCVNPTHLFLGTIADNMADRDRKARQAKGEQQHLAKLTAEQVRAIRGRYVPDSSTSGSTALAREFGVRHVTILRVVKGHCWKHVS